MKKIILSRKGFDSTAGGKASPILSNGNICSIPIPAHNEKFHGPSQHKYRDLKYDHVKMEDVFKEIDSKYSLDDYCHFDPQLNQSIGLFGQTGSAQTELANQNVGPGDIFLFFGWFRNYSKKKDLHHMFGWMQINSVLKEPDESPIKDFLKQKKIKHPHGEVYTNNTLYVSKEFIEIDNKKTTLKGFGMFKKTHPDLILTAPDSVNRSKWKMPKKYFSNTKNLFLNNRIEWIDEENCLINAHKGFGQEIVLNSELNPKLIDWVMELIQNHS